MGAVVKAKCVEALAGHMCWEWVQMHDMLECISVHASIRWRFVLLRSRQRGRAGIGGRDTRGALRARMTCLWVFVSRRARCAATPLVLDLTGCSSSRSGAALLPSSGGRRPTPPRPAPPRVMPHVLPQNGLLPNAAAAGAQGAGVEKGSKKPPALWVKLWGEP